MIFSRWNCAAIFSVEVLGALGNDSSCVGVEWSRIR